MEVVKTLDCLATKKNMSPFAASLLFTLYVHKRTLARRFANVIRYVAHTGVVICVATDLTNDNPASSATRQTFTAFRLPGDDQVSRCPAEHKKTACHNSKAFSLVYFHFHITVGMMKANVEAMKRRQSTPLQSLRCSSLSVGFRYDC